MTSQKLHEKHSINDTKKARLDTKKRLGVRIPLHCQDCEHSKTHMTGSTLWVSCRFQDGWRSINSVCNLPNRERKK